MGDVKGLINADTGEYVYALNTSAYGVLNFIEPDLTFDTSSLLPDQITQIVRMMKKLVLQMCLCLPTANTYKGYSYDVFTGLYYLQSRYYDPEVGRFINADDVDYLGVGNRPLSYNLFAYCENNPVNNSDPSGEITWGDLKQRFLNLFSTIKTAFFKYIENLYSVKNGKINISTDVFSTIINIAVKVLVSRKITTVTNLALKTLSKSFLNRNKAKLVVMAKSVIDWFLNAKLGKTIIKLLASHIAKKLGFKSGIVGNIVAGIGNNIKSVRNNIAFKTYCLISSMTSIGGIIAFFVFDIIDGFADGYLRIKISGGYLKRC